VAFYRSEDKVDTDDEEEAEEHHHRVGKQRLQLEIIVQHMGEAGFQQIDNQDESGCAAEQYR
jgi:hypothetical protein